MLIPSPRHTPADLALWRELEKADLVRAKTIEQKVARSIEAIREFAAADCYASISWGKDSVALAHLIRAAGVDLPLVHLRGVPTGNPDCPRVRDEFLSRYPAEYREVDVVYESIDLVGSDELERDGDRLWLRTMAAQGSRYLSGIRADESGGRAIRMRKWGLIGPRTCAPLGWWTAADVFAYLAWHDLPIHPAYAMFGGGRWRRDQLRTDELMGARGNQFGRAEWEREYYGDVLRRLEVLVTARG